MAGEFDVDSEYNKYAEYLHTIVNNESLTPIQKACIDDNFKAVTTLFNDNTYMEFKVLNDISLGVTLLHIACIRKNPKIVDILLGNNPNFKSVEETDKIVMLKTRTNIRTTLNPNEIVLEGTIIEGETPDETTLTGTIIDDEATPLHLACLAGSDGIVQLLVDSGADTTVTYKGATPLDIAKKGRFERIEKILMPKGANDPTPAASPTKSPRAWNPFTTKKGGTRKKNRKSRSRIRKTSKSRKRKVRNTRKNKL